MHLIFALITHYVYCTGLVNFKGQTSVFSEHSSSANPESYLAQTRYDDKKKLLNTESILNNITSYEQKMAEGSLDSYEISDSKLENLTKHKHLVKRGKRNVSLQSSDQNNKTKVFFHMLLNSKNITTQTLKGTINKIQTLIKNTTFEANTLEKNAFSNFIIKLNKYSKPDSNVLYKYASNMTILDQHITEKQAYDFFVGNNTATLNEKGRRNKKQQENYNAYSILNELRTYIDGLFLAYPRKIIEDITKKKFNKKHHIHLIVSLKDIIQQYTNDTSPELSKSIQVTNETQQSNCNFLADYLSKINSTNLQTLQEDQCDTIFESLSKLSRYNKTDDIFNTIEIESNKNANNTSEVDKSKGQIINPYVALTFIPMIFITFLTSFF